MVLDRRVVSLEASRPDQSVNEPEPDRRSEETGDELRLAIAVHQKDRKATAEFVEAYADSVYAYVTHRLYPNADEADDLVQEVFLAALQSIASYTGKAPLKSWLLGIARHKVDDYYRCKLRDARLDAIDSVDVERDVDLAELSEKGDLQRRALETLGRMREDYSLLLRWRYWDLKSAAEMATLTGRTEKSIERALARARAQFRKLWEDEDA
jgi:RNA polymerase sigma-70 factor (ECF subfamily)